MKSTYQILEEAWLMHRPSLIVCSYSGGYDSMVATHKTLNWSREYAHSTDIAVISIDTQIHADGWLAYVSDSAAKLGARRFEVWQSGRFEEWIKQVSAYGFGHTPQMHKIFFRLLKEDGFRAVLRTYKRHRYDRIMFVTGMRRLESKERASTPEYDRMGSHVWCNPLVHWAEDDVHSYRFEHDLPTNPYYAIGLGSGDCLCNWHRNIHEKTLLKYAVDASKVIMPLSEQCKRVYGYGYGQKPSEYLKQEYAGQKILFAESEVPYLCAGCERKQASNDLRENLLMQRMEW